MIKHETYHCRQKSTFCICKSYRRSSASYKTNNQKKQWAPVCPWRSRQSDSDALIPLLQCYVTDSSPLAWHYVPACGRCRPQRGPEAASGAVHANVYPGVALTETKQVGHSPVSFLHTLPQKHMASSRLMTYPQYTAWTVTNSTGAHKGQNKCHV